MRGEVAEANAVNLYSLGNSGLKISKIILGAMSFGNPAWEGWVMNEKDSLPLLEHAYKRGINTWDTVGLLPAFDKKDVLTSNCRQTSTPTAIASG